MEKSTWIRLRKDEYVINNEVFRMTPKKRKHIKMLDYLYLHEKRYG
jgi:hypothetical protein